MVARGLRAPPAPKPPRGAIGEEREPRPARRRRRAARGTPSPAPANGAGERRAAAERPGPLRRRGIDARRQRRRDRRPRGTRGAGAAPLSSAVQSAAPCASVTRASTDSATSWSRSPSSVDEDLQPLPVERLRAGELEVLGHELGVLAAELHARRAPAPPPATSSSALDRLREEVGAAGLHRLHREPDVVAPGRPRPPRGPDRAASPRGRARCRRAPASPCR